MCDGKNKMKLSPTVPWKCYLPKEAVISESIAGKIQSTGTCWVPLFKIFRWGGCSGSSLWYRGSLLRHSGIFSVVASGLSSPRAYGTLAPRFGIEPASPALEGGFLTTKEVPCWLLPDKMKMNPGGHEPGCRARTKTRQ